MSLDCETAAHLVLWPPHIVPLPPSISLTAPLPLPPPRPAVQAATTPTHNARAAPCRQRWEQAGGGDGGAAGLLRTQNWQPVSCRSQEWIESRWKHGGG
jgi:hypothetical protein